MARCPTSGLNDHDIAVSSGQCQGPDLEASGEDFEPNVFVYDAYPGGMGLSEPLYRLHDRLLSESRTLIAACGCRDGCPSCVGPVGEVGSRGKQVALVLLDVILDG